MSLEPIKNYPHLLFVNLAQNQITDVAPLGELPYLVSANLSENALAAPCVFPQAHLQAVDVSQNQIPTLQGFQSSSLSSLKINGTCWWHCFQVNAPRRLIACLANFCRMCSSLG